MGKRAHDGRHTRSMCFERPILPAARRPKSAVAMVTIRRSAVRPFAPAATFGCNVAIGLLLGDNLRSGGEVQKTPRSSILTAFINCGICREARYLHNTTSLLNL